MYSVEKSIAALLEHVKVLAGTEQLGLLEACGRVLAEDIVSNIDVPPADNSAMDGYAIKLDTKQAEYPLSQRIAAGAIPEVLQAGTAARIFTGAEIPEGADTVVIQENCEEKDETLYIKKLPEAGSNIRRKGQDIRKNAVILQKGTRLQAQHIGIIASVGISKVELYKPLKIAVISSGDELVEPGYELKKGQIYNSNRPMIMGVCKAWGMEVVDLNIVNDNLAETEKALQQAAEQADMVITSGGVSVGEEDHIKQAVENTGELMLWKILMKPGKPFAFGHVNNTPFIGLPGNPSSAFVTLLVIAREFILRSQGLKETAPVYVSATADFERKEIKRQEYLRAKLVNGEVQMYANQSSGVLSSVCWANCFAIQEIGKEIEKGQPINVLLFSDLLN